VSGSPTRRRGAALAVGAAVLFLVLLAALRSDAATTLVVGVLVVVAVGVWWRRNASAAGSVVSLAVTLVLTSMTTEWASTRSPLVSPVRSGLVYWLFAAVVVATVWLTPSPRGSRAVTTAWAHSVLVVTSVLVPLAPAAVPILGLGAAMVVIAWRSRPPRFGRSRWRWRTWPARLAGGARAWSRWPRSRSRPKDDVARGSVAGGAALLRGVGRTGKLLAELGPSWHVIADRRLDDGTVVEHLLVGPAGVIVVATRRWGGRVSLVHVADDTADLAYALDGDPHALAARLVPLARAVCGVADHLGVDVMAADQTTTGAQELAVVVGVTVLWDDTVLPVEQVELTVLPRGVDRSVPVVVVRGDDLVAWLRSRPARLTDEQVERLARRAARLAGGDSLTPPGRR
jgi:hypothetical protein